MKRKEYSAGATKLSFWFLEFRKMVSLLRSGKSMDEIRTLAEGGNIFSASTPARSKQICSALSARLAGFPSDLTECFENCGIERQKLIALVAIMNTDSLFFDFMNEVYREKLLTGDPLLTDADARVFFLNKQRESEKAAGWTDGTLTRLRQSYHAWLAESGLLERGADGRKIIRPIVDGGFAELLAENGMKPILNALTGAR